jgi:hypothetical protein
MKEHGRALLGTRVTYKILEYMEHLPPAASQQAFRNGGWVKATTVIGGTRLSKFCHMIDVLEVLQHIPELELKLLKQGLLIRRKPQ